MESEQESEFPNHGDRIENREKFPVNVLSEMKFPERWFNFYQKRAVNKKLVLIKGFGTVNKDIFQCVFNCDVETKAKFRIYFLQSIVII